MCPCSSHFVLRFCEQDPECDEDNYSNKTNLFNNLFINILEKITYWGSARQGNLSPIYKDP